MGLAHHDIEASAPRTVALAELAVLQPLGVLGFVLLPQQRQRHPLAAAFGVDPSPVRNGAFDTGLDWCDGEQPRFERGLVERLGQRPRQARGLGSADVVADGGW